MQRLIEKQKRLEQAAKQQLLIQQQQQNNEKEKKEKAGAKDKDGVNKTDKDKEGVKTDKAGEISKDPRLESKFVYFLV